MKQQRWLLTLAYNGGGLHGWQWQPNVPTLEALVKRAVSQVANHAVDLTVCGRTDRGVHAVGQCVHFDSLADRRPEQWLCGINTHLPASIRVQHVQKVSSDFHARFSATARLYRYCIEIGSAPSPMLYHGAWWMHQPLDVKAMNEAAVFCLGEQDFSAFRGPDCQSSTPMRNMMHCSIVKVSPSFCIVSVKANAFLHHMVRLLVAALVQIGRGKQAPNWLLTTLQGKVKPSHLVMAPSGGLYFWQAFYGNDPQIECAAKPQGGWFDLIDKWEGL